MYGTWLAFGVAAHDFADQHTVGRKYVHIIVDFFGDLVAAWRTDSMRPLRYGERQREVHER